MAFDQQLDEIWGRFFGKKKKEAAVAPKTPKKKVSKKKVAKKKRGPRKKKAKQIQKSPQAIKTIYDIRKDLWINKQTIRHAYYVNMEKNLLQFQRDNKGLKAFNMGGDWKNVRAVVVFHPNGKYGVGEGAEGPYDIEPAEKYAQYLDPKFDAVPGPRFESTLESLGFILYD